MTTGFTYTAQVTNAVSFVSFFSHYQSQKPAENRYAWSDCVVLTVWSGTVDVVTDFILQVTLSLKTHSSNMAAKRYLLSLPSLYQLLNMLMSMLNTVNPSPPHRIHKPPDTPNHLFVSQTVPACWLKSRWSSLATETWRRNHPSHDSSWLPVINQSCFCGVFDTKRACLSESGQRKGKRSCRARFSSRCCWQCLPQPRQMDLIACSRLMIH